MNINFGTTDSNLSITVNHRPLSTDTGIVHNFDVYVDHAKLGEDAEFTAGLNGKNNPASVTQGDGIIDGK